MLPDVLRHFDLPQVASVLASRRLVMLDPVDAMKSRVDLETVRSVYQAAAQVATRRPDISLAGQYLQLLG